MNGFRTSKMCRRFQWAHSMHHDKYRRIVNVEECVKKVREYRMHSVQSLPQFEYIYILMLRHIFLVKVSRGYFDYIEFRWLIVFSAFIKIWEHEEFFFFKAYGSKNFHRYSLFSQNHFVMSLLCAIFKMNAFHKLYTFLFFIIKMSARSSER